MVSTEDCWACRDHTEKKSCPLYCQPHFNYLLRLCSYDCWTVEKGVKCHYSHESLVGRVFEVWDDNVGEWVVNEEGHTFKDCFYWFGNPEVLTMKIDQYPPIDNKVAIEIIHGGFPSREGFSKVIYPNFFSKKVNLKLAFLKKASRINMLKNQ